MPSALINGLSNTVTSGAYKIQFAVNREYEKAFKIDLTDSAVLDETEITKFIGADPRIIAGEVFFKTNDGKDCYIGIQWDETFTNAKKPRIFLETYLETVIAGKDNSFIELLSELGTAFVQTLLHFRVLSVHR